MKYFTLFIILTIMSVYADDSCVANQNHCKTCDECDGDQCIECEVYDKAVEKGWPPMYIQDPDYSYKCKCNTENGYSLTSSGNCVHCDNGCTSGCVEKGDDKCDSACNTPGYWFDGKNFQCEHCDDNCSTETTYNWCKTQGAGKCDEKCVSGWTLYVNADDKTNDHTCKQCDKHCTTCNQNGATFCDDQTYCITHLENELTDTGFYLDTDNKCQLCTAHCTQCTTSTNGKDGVCDDTKCVKGYYKEKREGTNKGKCVKCVDNCLECTDDNGNDETNKDGKGKCDENKCAPGYYRDDKGRCQQCIGNCKECVDGESCKTCNDGYTYNPSRGEKDETNACVKIDCTPVDKNCDICVGPDRNDLTCTKCKTGFEREIDDVYQEEEEDVRHRCVDITKTIECTIQPAVEGGEVKKEYHRTDKCYTEHHERTGEDYYHKYFKYEKASNGKVVKCDYYDEDCEYKVQTAKVTDITTCVKIGEKYYKYDKCGPAVNEYTNSACTEGKTKITTSKCVRDAKDDYVKILTTGTTFIHYHEKDCDEVNTDSLPSAIIYEDKKCEEIDKETMTCVWPVEPTPDPSGDPVDTSCEVANCSECSEDKKTCTKCASGYTLKDNTCEKNSDGSNDDGDKCGSIMNIIMLTILIISLMI